MARCLNCIHFDVCDTDRHEKERLYGDCRDFLNDADVEEVKHGKWEIVKGSNGREKMVCTACRHQQDLHSTFTYCPNCGAIMHGTIRHEK